MSSLNHPNICTLHDVGREGETDELKWQGHDPMPSSRNREDLVAEVDRDRHGCFFG